MGTTFTTEEIAKMTYKDLRTACGEANISKGGDTKSLRKRLKQWCTTQTKKTPQKKKRSASVTKIEDGSSDNKRQKFNPADDLICPITTDLPVDPVTAEDGRVYERTAIEEYIKTRNAPGQELRSPITNEIMGKRLLPATQHKNLVAGMIASGAIEGDLAAHWNTKLKEKDVRDSILMGANDGNVEDMYELAQSYRNGKYGIHVDFKAAYSWYQKCHDAGELGGTYWMGCMNLNGQGVPKNDPLGISYISLCAGKGCRMASYVLGMGFAEGNYGLPANKTEAAKWISTSLKTTDPKFRPLDKEFKARAQRALRQLKQK